MLDPDARQGENGGALTVVSLLGRRTQARPIGPPESHPDMPPSDLEARLQAVERLTRLFRLERMVHLVVTGLALLMLLTSAGVLIYRQQAGPAELTMLFGSSGLITYSAGRLLHMWNQALRIIAGQELEKTV